MAARKKKAPGVTPAPAKSYQHPTAELTSRPEVGQQDSFRAKKPPTEYAYDPSLAPQLQWDGGGAKVRERAEELLRIIEEGAGDSAHAERVRAAAAELRRMQAPFLEWSGKAEHAHFTVPTLPLFVHERLSTEAILESVSGFRHNQQQDLFGDPQRSLVEQLRAYEHRDRWVNRMILGDSLVVMNSLLEYEGMGGKVQMIYIDPPYGVKFGSNFQPFVRSRDVTHGSEADLTREPEMVSAYRDTWQCGLHSYLQYLRDRLLVARDLLAPSGSVFVQIADANQHHVREVLDEVFGAENFLTTIVIQKTSAEETNTLPNTADALLWYARSARDVKFRPLIVPKRPGAAGAKQYVYVRNMQTGAYRKMTEAELSGAQTLDSQWRICRRGYPITSQHWSETRSGAFRFEGKEYFPGKDRQWSVDPQTELPKLVAKGRLYASEGALNAWMYLDEVPGTELGNVWTDTGTGSFTADQLYVVQTSEKVVARCILMTTDPGDLVLDPTCGSGTTAFVAEHWGRRWVTVDTSRVPLALARQRMLTATYPWYKLKDEPRGPAGGFVYARRQNSKGEEIGGLVPHSTLSSIANDEPPQMAVLVDRPDEERKTTRVTGPFVVEATIPTPVDWEGDGESDAGVQAAEDHAAFTDRMVEVLRRAPRIHLGGNETAEFEQVRVPAKAMVLSAEGVVKGGTDRVAFVFGPEHGAVAEVLVHQALKEADRRNYTRLYVIAFAIDPHARQLIEQTRDEDHPASNVPAWYVQATPDLIMGSLLKTTKASQLFSVCGLPEVSVDRLAGNEGEPDRFTVTLNGVDMFDPESMTTHSQEGMDVPAWFLDADYNGRVFRISQAFFPRTHAWDALKRALKADFNEALFDHLAGDTSSPFEAGAHRTIAVKVIDDRGNELMVVKELPA